MWLISRDGAEDMLAFVIGLEVINLPQCLVSNHSFQSFGVLQALSLFERLLHSFILITHLRHYALYYIPTSLSLLDIFILLVILKLDMTSISSSNSGSKIHVIKDKVVFSDDHIKYLNEKLSKLSPKEVLEWSIENFPDLYQTTAFGLTGLVTVDMLSKMEKGRKVELIFLDTLHHFPQTLDLVQRVQERYPSNKVHIFKPLGVNTEREFTEKYGENLWEAEEERYDFLVKVEPAQRSYKELDVVAVFTGRRRSQGGSRNSLPIIEVDEASNIIKINPFASWSFNEVLSYIKENNVPYNELLDLGYRSVGDYHSTHPVKDGEDERAGRWKGREKTECGIHETSKFAKFLKDQQAVVSTSN